jgi:AraC family transcriptional regulator of adaptative response / DNA-3-methyladenine glycosylase II
MHTNHTPTTNLPLNADNCYQALVSRDARFDGRFFVGVSSTRIYCRVVCPAKTPRRENCTFYPSAAAAERAGYRPCLRCRPELAPGNAVLDAVSRLAAEAASRIEDGVLTEASVGHLAAELGISERHLRRVVEREFGVTPIELAQTHRLLLAKRLLTDTDLPVIEVAYASGFSSLRRFNALFKERYRLNPTGLRKAQPHRIAQRPLVCDLAYHPPLDWAALLGFLSARTITGVEQIDGLCYRRTAAFGKHRGWLAVEPVPGKALLRVSLAPTLAPVLPQVLAAVKRLFDLLAPPALIAGYLGALALANPGLRVPGAFDGFEVAVRAILGQQVSVKAASTLAGRLAIAFGEAVETPYPELAVLTPTAARLAGAAPEEIMALGITRSRATAIVALAQAVAAGAIRLEPRVDVAEAMDRLRDLPGVGEWTAQYVAMRALSWPDGFPHGDLGIRKALNEPNSNRVFALAEAWRPWRAYAAMHLWKSLETPACLTELEPQPQIA